MTTELRPAKITVRFDVDAAKRDLEGLERARAGVREERRPTGPRSDGETPRDRTEAGRPSEPTRGREEAPGSSWVSPGARQALALTRQALSAAAGRGGRLSDAVAEAGLSAFESIPGVGDVAGPRLRAVYRLGEGVERFGPGFGAAVEEALPEGLARDVAGGLRAAGDAAARTMARLRAPLDAVGETAQVLAEIGAGQARLRGSANTEALSRLADPLYRVNETLYRYAATRRQIGQAASGEAVGRLLRSAVAGTLPGVVGQ